ncbi:hypothetical protein [Natrialbaceae archaeon AArc-T1-2]|uniref:hypothetical protein n=1 Tax=Natrialbaceae archaeon AArc-T1-2 TaxID=3053904 RepID=UPI00255B2215|nr:hypothetical protein [Natrialbaceae archaeon AArc-T1-2]WIV66339.1 hypothetical protein QQ977_11630 [Natrialbaceae archaeon AArc-T1-2]
MDAYGILTDDADLARADLGDVTYYFTDQVDGSREEPLEGAVSSVACWGDTETVRENPDRAAVAADGTRATPAARGQDWGTVCPTDPDYRADLLERIAEAGATGDVRLTTLGFPGAEFCHCQRCDRLFADSAHDDREDWRADVITGFVAEAADRVAGELIATLYPDPYPGALRERTGLDPGALASHVDGFLVPLCGAGYGTTYWVESLASGFDRELAGLDAEFAIQLSTDGVEIDRLVDLTHRLEAAVDVDSVVYGAYGSDRETLRDVIGRLRETDAPAAPA